MKAVQLVKTKTFEMNDVARPEPGEGEALVHITYCGICGTDEKIWDGGIPVQHPLIMGHEMVGVIEQGEGVDGARPGDRVLIDPCTFCGVCFHCRMGQTHLCPNGTVLGRDEDGGFAEYCVAPKVNVFPLPDTVGDREGPLIQVLTTAFHAHRRADIIPGEAVAIIGLGVTGQMHVQLAKARGANPVIGIARTEEKLQLAKDFGADIVVHPGEEAKKAVLDATDGRGVDLAIESVGKLSVLAEAMDLTRAGGRVLPFGIYTEKVGELPYYDFYFKELDIINARAARSRDFPACIDLVGKGIVNLEPILTHDYALDQLGDALEFLATPNKERLKITIHH